ncbi:mRNA-binding ubiquitin-specific protease [Maudiozyma humilis]|uniref:Ubiquitin carboxyl-terminal hydrolase n=1 Tax=Maudiozyma humilis TaxID=51915 RepID=A0AAV5RXA2_MAUHU|nr:mRNA-binding ubiquitin-specific protease [Kazachstania humilis]
MNGQDNQEESYSMYPKTSSPPAMQQVNMQFPMYQNPMPMYNYQPPYGMYAQPNYNFKMMNQGQGNMGYQGNMNGMGGNPGGKKKWNNNNNNNANNNANGNGGNGMNPAKSQPYYPSQSQSFYSQNGNQGSSNTKSSSVNADPFKFDVSKLNIAEISENCRKFPLYINTTASEFAEAKAKRFSARSNSNNSNNASATETASATPAETTPAPAKETPVAKEEKTAAPAAKVESPAVATPASPALSEKKADSAAAPSDTKKKTKDADGKKKEKEVRVKKEDELKKSATTASSTSIASVASDTTTAPTSPAPAAQPAAAATPVATPAPAATPASPPAPKSWSAIASSAAPKSKITTTNKALSAQNPALATIGVGARQKKDKKYVPPSTKGAEPLGSIAIRTCFDPDYVDYVLKKHGPAGENDLPLKNIIPRGIINSANICFMSSVLQVLLYCRPFVDLLNVLSTRNPSSRIGTSSTKLWDACINIFKNFDKETFEKERESTPVQGGSKKSSREGTPKVGNGEFASVAEAIKPDEFYRSLSTIGKFKDLQWGHQEDAEEFLTQMLDQLHEELIAAINYLTENEIQNILQSISDEDLKVHIIRNLARYKDAQFLRSATGQLPALIEKYGNVDENDDENGWHEVSGSSKKGKKNKTAAKRTVEVIPSPISNLFGGQFRSVLDIPNNKESQSITLDPFQTIQLDISDPAVNDLESAFKKFSEYELIPFKSSSGDDVEAKKQTFIDKLPEVLLVQLKRFSFINNTDTDNSMTNYNAYSGRIEKIRKKINYGHEMTIPVDSVSSPSLKQNEKNRKYALSGVIYHHGLSSDGGHYTCDVYHKPNDKWYRIDDVAITELKKEDVLTVGDSGADPRTAYILMYQKI